MKLHEVSTYRSLSNQTWLDIGNAFIQVNAPLNQVRPLLAQYGESVGLISQETFEHGDPTLRLYFNNIHELAEYLKQNLVPDAKKWGQQSYRLNDTAI